MFGVSHFKDKVAIVAGSEHPLGRSLVLRLSAFGAIPIAIGCDQSALLALAQSASGHVETLNIASQRRDVLELLREAWKDEPVDLLVDLFGLSPADDGTSAGPSFGRTARLLAAMGPGVRSGAARVVVAVPQQRDDAPEVHARSAGFSALSRRFSKDCHPARLVSLHLPDDHKAWTEDASLCAGDAVLMLCHPVSRGIANGSDVVWSAQT